MLSLPFVDIYCRTARDGPDAQASLERQETACRAYCTANSLTVASVHHEVASGVTYQQREKLNLVRSRYHRGDIAGLVVSNLDRLSRSLVHLVILVSEMDDYGVVLHCANAPLEASLDGKLLRFMVDFFGDMEREMASNRRCQGRITQTDRCSLYK
jgi:DNA invertase Pin-like site-specific DNA recombinase